KQFDRGEIDAEGKPRFQGFRGGDPRGRAGGPGGGFEAYSFRTGGGGPGGAGGAGFEDILNSMFGGAARGGRPGGGRTFEFDTGGIGLDLDLNVAMTGTLEESVKGGEKRVRLPTGKELNVRIPAGVVAGQQIRLKGQGETAPGHPAGDLLITVSIAPHPYFKVEGSDLRLDLPISLYEAVLGGKVRVPTLGSAVELSIPKNTSSARTFRLKGKGLPKAGGAGDLFVITRIILPDGNDAELEALMEKWRDGHPYNPRSDFGGVGRDSQREGVCQMVRDLAGIFPEEAAYFHEDQGVSGQMGGLERGSSAVENPDRGRLRRSADRTLLIFA